MRADNTDRLRAAPQERAERTLARAVEALNTMADGTVTVARLAAAAGVSRSWIYTQPQLLKQIEALTRTRPHVLSTDRPAAQRASSASLHRRLDLAHQRVRQLSAENEQLRRRTRPSLRPPPRAQLDLTLDVLTSASPPAAWMDLTSLGDQGTPLDHANRSPRGVAQGRPLITSFWRMLDEHRAVSFGGLSGHCVLPVDVPEQGIRSATVIPATTALPTTQSVVRALLPPG